MKKNSLALDLVPVRFCPSRETLAVLNERNWICSFSGGKDSTSLVTWIEWLRRSGMVKCESPKLVLSDTGVEYPFLQKLAWQTMTALTASGWHCEVVRPKVHERLYNRIFGIGNTPVHPGGRKRMRWCTRATKIDPMLRWSKSLGTDTLQLTGVRWGESDARDGKLSAGGCSAGGECGLPDPGERVYGPIITWKTCKVIEWLSGEVEQAILTLIPDLSPTMKHLVDVYEVKVTDSESLFDVPPKITALRFGCIGCPAISNEKITNSREAKRHPAWQHLRRIYGIWAQLYLRKNRCCRIKASASIRIGPKPTWSEYHVGFGPIRMEARKRYFNELLGIQNDSGVTLVSPEDVAFIRQCWAEKRYPRGWSEADELVLPPKGEWLFEN